MKRKKHTKLKIVQVFRLPPGMVEKLASHSVKTNINQTRLVELALTQFFAVKRA